MFISIGGGKRIILLEASESFPARHSDFEDDGISFLYKHFLFVSHILHILFPL